MGEGGTNASWGKHDAEGLTKEAKKESGSCFSTVRGTTSVISGRSLIPEEESLGKHFWAGILEKSGNTIVSGWLTRSNIDVQESKWQNLPFPMPCPPHNPQWVLRFLWPEAHHQLVHSHLEAERRQKLCCQVPGEGSRIKCGREWCLQPPDPVWKDSTGCGLAPKQCLSGLHSSHPRSLTPPQAFLPYWIPGTNSNSPRSHSWTESIFPSRIYLKLRSWEYVNRAFPGAWEALNLITFPSSETS